ncbi:MAG: cation transporter [Sphingomonas sp.]|nr:cation transporter [Sphingomonas sp.]
MADDCCATKGKELERLANKTDQRRVLVIVLLINAVMFLAEFGAGLVAGSAALMADASDMLGDALVYGLSLYAISKGDRWKAGAAAFKGVFILFLALGILVNIMIKIASGVPPSSALMLGFGAAALVANLVCLGLLWRFRSQDLNMASTFECSRNDVISNVGVMVAAAAVAATSSPWPDIVIGAAMAAIIFRSSIRVLGEAIPQLKAGNA